MTLREYAVRSREFAVGVFFIIPFLAIYEVGIVLLGSRVRNGADVLFRDVFGLLGSRGLVLFNLLLLVGFVAAAGALLRRDRPVLTLYPAVLLEACLYALLLAPTVFFLEEHLFPYLEIGGRSEEPWLSVVLSVGAGVYEEIFFRLLLLGGLLRLFERACGVRRWIAVVSSLLIASVLFSAFHHVGAYGEPFRLSAFVFRAISGMILGSIFLSRGLAVVVYTHAFYDIFIFFQNQARG